MFSLTLSLFPTFLFKYFFHLSALVPILFLSFFSAFTPPPSLPFTPALLYFLLPHLHSFLSPIPSYTLCPLTLNHRWTKQWAMSHSIKTNNPVMGGGLCGAGAAYPGNTLAGSKQPLISDRDDSIHRWTFKAAYMHTHSYKEESRKITLGGSIVR